MGAIQVASSRKGSKSRTHGRKFRPTGTKANMRPGRMREPRADLEQQLETYKRELAEAREQQAATADVLKIISGLPGELQPVFDAVLTNATRLCDAKFARLFLSEGDQFRSVGLHNAPAAFAEYLSRTPLVRPSPDSALGRTALTHQVAHIDDICTTPAYLARDPFLVAGVELGGYRTVLSVPMLKEGELIGAIVIFRQEVRPFTDKQIELVRNFAAQAVIAIENTRLLNELRESLQQQTATAEVLGVISSSPGDLEPVFQAMLENAVRICEAKFGILFRHDGQAFELAAELDTPPEFAEFQRRRGPFQPIPGGHLDRILRTKHVSHTDDNAADAIVAVSATLGGARSAVGVPMIKDDVVIGVIFIYRQEVRPFTDKQIELLRNFAALRREAAGSTRLDSEHFRCCPRTCRPLRDTLGALRWHKAGGSTPPCPT